jgi:hypothetical protein
LQGGASVSLPPSSAPSPSLFFLLSLKNIEGKSVYSHLSSPFFKNIEGRSVYSLSLSLFSYEIPLSLLKGSILRKYIEEAYRGKEAYRGTEAHRGKGRTQMDRSTPREWKHIEEGKYCRIVTLVMKQGPTNQVTDPPVPCLLPLPPF